MIKVRNRINTFEHNKKFNNRILNRETIIKEQFNNATGEELKYNIHQAMSAAYVLDAEFKKKYISFNQDSVILAGKYTEEALDKYLPINNIEEKFSKMQPFFNDVTNISNHLKRTQTGQQLILNARELNSKINYSMNLSKTNSSISDLNEAYSNFKKASSFYVFDTETLSGMGKTCYNELDSLQEIAFRKFNKINGKLVEDTASRIETLIGITKEQRDEYMKVFIDDFDKNGWQGNQKYEVIAGRFAKLGHSDTKISKTGRGLKKISKKVLKKHLELEKLKEQSV